MKILTLNLKKEYFEQIKSGQKKFEYRLKKDFWTKRLSGKEYSKVVIKLGYPKNDDLDKIMEFPWKGFVEQEITHKEFGSDPVKVYAIIL